MKFWLAAAVAAFAWPCAAMAQDRPSDLYPTCLAAEGADARLSQICATVDDLYEALSHYDFGRHGAQHAEIQYLLGSALYALGYSGDVAALRDSIAASRAALPHYSRGRSPTRLAVVQLNIANASLALAETGEQGALEAAVAAIQTALGELNRTDQPEVWAMAQRTLGDAYVMQANETQDQAKFVQAVEAYRASLEIYRRARYAEERARVEARIAEILEVIGPGASTDG